MTELEFKTISQASSIGKSANYKLVFAEEEVEGNKQKIQIKIEENEIQIFLNKNAPAADRKIQREKIEKKLKASLSIE